MPAVILHRIDPARNMHRYYRLDVQRDLFGEWGIVREWGRIGQTGQYRVDPHPTAEQAEERMLFQQAAKQGIRADFVGAAGKRSQHNERAGAVHGMDRLPDGKLSVTVKAIEGLDAAVIGKVFAAMVDQFADAFDVDREEIWGAMLSNR